MTRVGWGKAFAFAGLAVGAPWVVVALIATALLALSAPGTGGGFVELSGGIAAVSVVLCAMITKIRAPRSRTAAVVHAWLACALGIALVPLAILIPGGAWTFAPIVAMMAELIFFVG
ncbi:MAG TPA: hypothetical protein VKZ73_07065, partial [Microbacterium sp.]|nr:hypothetical protein [Microbacterium sp.]